MLSVDVSTVTVQDENGAIIDDNALANFAFDQLQGEEEPAPQVDAATELLTEMLAMKEDVAEIQAGIEEIKKTLAAVGCADIGSRCAGSGWVE